MLFQEEILGFHGTTENKAEEILNKGYSFTDRPDHWLGEGVYFFLNSKFAKWWAFNAKKKYNDNACILQSQINYNKENLLDLDDPEGLSFFYSEVEKIKQDIGEDYVFNNSHERRCYYLNMIKSNHEHIKIITYTFQMKNPTYGNGVINDCNLKFGFRYNQLQICTDIDLITNTVIHKKEEELLAENSINNIGTSEVLKRKKY